MTLSEGISLVKEALSALYSSDEVGAISARLLEHYFGVSRTSYLLSPNLELDEANIQPLLQSLQKLQTHCPIQYVLGETEFYGLRFKVTEDVLIPRPETEELVEWILTDHKEQHKNILDIGTGSGCIAIALAKQLPSSAVTALDISTAALNIAKENAELNEVPVHFVEADIFSPPANLFKAKFDVIVSNPPYVRELERHQMSANVLDYEPSLALFVPNNDPLRYYRAIALFASVHLAEEGAIYLEINEALGSETASLFEENGFSSTELRYDLSGKPRMLKAGRT